MGTLHWGGVGGGLAKPGSYIYIYIPGTQMTPVLIGKGLLFEGSNPKIEDKQVPGIYTLEVQRSLKE